MLHPLAESVESKNIPARQGQQHLAWLQRCAASGPDAEIRGEANGVFPGSVRQETVLGAGCWRT